MRAQPLFEWKRVIVVAETFCGNPASDADPRILINWLRAIGRVTI
jgi:hypothetical protein